jgi:hypothetical protein
MPVVCILAAATNRPDARLISEHARRADVNSVLTADSFRSIARHGWPYFGLTTTLKVAAHCASLTSISAGQRPNRQVVDATVDLYGSDALERCRI